MPPSSEKYATRVTAAVKQIETVLRDGQKYLADTPKVLWLDKAAERAGIRVHIIKYPYIDGNGDVHAERVSRFKLVHQGVTLCSSRTSMIKAIQGLFQHVYDKKVPTTGKSALLQTPPAAASSSSSSPRLSRGQRAVEQANRVLLAAKQIEELDDEEEEMIPAAIPPANAPSPPPPPPDAPPTRQAAVTDKTTLSGRVLAAMAVHDYTERARNEWINDEFEARYDPEGGGGVAQLVNTLEVESDMHRDKWPSAAALREEDESLLREYEAVHAKVEKRLTLLLSMKLQPPRKKPRTMTSRTEPHPAGGAPLVDTAVRTEPHPAEGAPLVDTAVEAVD